MADFRITRYSERQRIIMNLKREGSCLSLHHLGLLRVFFYKFAQGQPTVGHLFPAIGGAAGGSGLTSTWDLKIIVKQQKML